MKQRRIILYAQVVVLAVFWAGVSTALHQKDVDDIKTKKNELEKLRKHIQDYEKKIAENEKKEQSTLDLLDDYDRQTALISYLLTRLREDENQLEEEIQRKQNEVRQTASQLASLRDEYSRYVVSVYRQGKSHDLELLFSSKSLNQMYIRLEYLQHFSDQRERDVQNIKTKQSQLEEQTRTLDASLEEQRELIASKMDEEKTLARKVVDRQHLLASIRRDKKNYKRELDRKSRAAKELEDIIADLVEREKIQREHEKALARERAARTPVKPKASRELAFADRRGSLSWPVSAHSIVAHFGNQVHPILKTVTLNYGIDISVPENAEIRAVAAGDVALISFLPGYGNLVILNHQDGYRTVYAHLSEILVSQGNSVEEGQLIGRSSDSVSGSILHFELWKERDKQNPEEWLRKR